ELYQVVGKPALPRSGLKLDKVFVGDVIGLYGRSPLLGEIWVTNVPRVGVFSSYEGHRWGYCCPGSDDLAIDILFWFIPILALDFDITDSNKIPNVLIKHYQKFSEQFLSSHNPMNSLLIRSQFIINWLRSNGVKPGFWWTAFS
ncbi:hypothetical protein RZS08_08920, partial [Arthrospira platensis SPKY1]|nr:hypothetical protein [Arthrospira platensis SPKY1]